MSAPTLRDRLIALAGDDWPCTRGEARAIAIAAARMALAAGVADIDKLSCSDPSEYCDGATHGYADAADAIRELAATLDEDRGKA